MARFSEGIYEPITVLILASMVTPFGLTIAYFLGKIIRKNILNRQEIDTLKTRFSMGSVRSQRDVPYRIERLGTQCHSNGSRWGSRWRIKHVSGAQIAVFRHRECLQSLR